MDEYWHTRSDAEIIDACLHGDDTAWQALVLKYKRLVYSVPVKWGLHPQDSVDIFQSVWMDCFRQLPSLRVMRTLQPWLIRVAVRKCYRFSQQSRARGEAPLEEEACDAVLDEVTPASLIAELDRDQMLRSAIEKLSPRCREVIRCLFFEEPRPSYYAIASRLGLSENSIGFTRERCLHRLRRILKELGYSQ
jgi:RNA polymerase sigma factor (sigma-70 family)